MGVQYPTMEIIMNTCYPFASAALALALFACSDHAGCGKGAILGGVAGHMAGKHGVAGAAAGCAIGHHAAKKKEKAYAAASSSPTPATGTATTKK